GGQQVSLANHGYVDRNINALTRSGNKFVAIESQNDGTSGIFLSTDRGDTWSQMRGARGLAGVHLKTIAGLRSEDRILLAASTRQLYKSIDGGMSWKPIPVRLVIPPPLEPVSKATPETDHHTTNSKVASRARTRPPVRPVVKIREINPSEVYSLYSV